MLSEVEQLVIIFKSSTIMNRQSQDNTDLHNMYCSSDYLVAYDASNKKYRMSSKRVIYRATKSAYTNGNIFCAMKLHIFCIFDIRWHHATFEKFYLHKIFLIDIWHRFVKSIDKTAIEVSLFSELEARRLVNRKAYSQPKYWSTCRQSISILRK